MTANTHCMTDDRAVSPVPVTSLGLVQHLFTHMLCCAALNIAITHSTAILLHSIEIHWLTSSH